MDVIGHFKTITRHHNLVMGYCFRAGLYRQGLLHDLSKYSPEEFLVIDEGHAVNAFYVVQNCLI